MIEAILLDLDNTLLHLDEKEFISRYLMLLAPKFSDVLSPKEFNYHFLKATGAMMKNCSPKTNLEAFLDDFIKSAPVISRAEMLKRFESFYNNEFTQVGKICSPNPFSKEIIERLSDMSPIKVVLATNPLFPRSAVLERLSWARIDPEIFDLITDCENMHCCKPQKGYFLEVCAKIEVKPFSCLMVGNDRINDMAAGHLGMITFLVLDDQTAPFAPFASIQREMSLKKETPLPDFCGSLGDLSLLFDLVNRCFG